VEGQLHGAVAQGAGQALGETCVYDAGGQLVSASFLDYSVPRADDFPEPRSENDESQPCTHNPLGAKGCGEAGAIAAPAAIVNAVLDALAPLGVDEIEMPVTPHRVWQAIVRARREQAAAG
jgi:carbon-monoxide dehydrogenase large subunit